MKPYSAKSKMVALVLLAGVLPPLASLAAHLIIGDAKHVHEPLHECFELAGTCIALAVAMLLLLRLRHEAGSQHLFWVVASLIAMGLVDGLHAVHGISIQSWQRHGATLLGGVIFGMVWLPLPPAVTRRRGLFGLVVAGLALALGLWWGSAGMPATWDPVGLYTLPVKAANALGGLGFLAAALFFCRRYRRQPETEALVFAGMTLLFGMSSLLFASSHTWAADWWVTHGFRLLAYAIVLVVAYETIVTLYRQIAERAQELERRVQERTAELLKTNETLRTEIVERERLVAEVEQRGNEQARLNAELTRSNRATLNLMQDAVQAQQALSKLNAELEQRVGDRTAQLEAANRELEAFSYSVSHDLRAPLRHVQGYVDMLAREAEGQLSDKGRRYMQTIVDVGQEMGVLIDDLLAFSRMGRAEMTETMVNLNSLVQDARRDLGPATRERNIGWNIPPLLAVQADPAMLKLVLTNLLGNAVKFMRPRDPAQIEMGSAGTEDGRVILFVRDNGVGFDPQYAHKLFGVFQRLHRADEFEGTGIGLANVRRIIARHGGRTWAEGKLNAGATFYFTLKPSTSTNPAN